MNPSFPSLHYDELPLWSAPFGLAILDTIHLTHGMNILDIGSGSGFPMLEIAERAGVSCKIYGIDPSDDAILMIGQKTDAKGIKNVKMIKGFAEKLPFEDNFFDLIVSNNGINNVEDPKPVLRECFRVCRNGAQLVITVNLPDTMIEFYDVFEETLRKNGLQDEIRMMKEHIFEKRKPTDYLKDLIERSGFTIREMKNDSFKYRYVDGTTFFNHFLIRNYFLPSWRSVVPDLHQKNIFGEIESSLNKIPKEKGELIITIPFVLIDCKKNLPQRRKDAKM